jgi:hypothetical protein
MALRKRRSLAVGITLAAAMALPASAHEDALLPIPTLLRPKPTARPAGGARSAVRGGCAVLPLPTRGDSLPFGPGETLGYEVRLLGVRTGRVDLRMGEQASVDGERVYPLFASAQTTGFLSVLGELDGRMISYLDPETGRPVRMVNRFVTDTLGSPRKLAREDAAFSSDAQVAGELTYQQGSEESTRPARLRATGDLLDALSVIYYARSRTLTQGEPFCFEIYHRRRLWRVEGRVGETKVVSAPFGSRRAQRVEGTLTLVGGGDQRPRHVVAWVSDDADRLPLLVQTPDRMGTLSVRLTGFSSGRRLSRAAEGASVARGR